MSGRLDSSDLLEKLEAYADIDPPGICWLWPDDTGVSYCFACAEEQINYFGRGTFVDGGWGGQESDCCIHCETCGRMLDYSLTEAGVEYELDHFRGLRFRKPPYRDDAAHIAKMLASAPDNKEVVAVARRAVRAIKVQARIQQTLSYAVYIDGYGEANYTAPSPAKARAMAYRDFYDAVTRKTFHEFLVMSRVRRAERPGGEPPVSRANGKRGAS